MNLLELVIMGIGIGFLIGYSAGLLIGYTIVMALNRRNDGS